MARLNYGSLAQIFHISIVKLEKVMLAFVVISLLVIMFNIFSLHLIELSRAYKPSLDRRPYA